MAIQLLKCPLCGEVVHVEEADDTTASRVCPTCGGELDSPKAVKAKLRKQKTTAPPIEESPSGSRPLSPSDAAAASSAGWVPTADMSTAQLRTGPVVPAKIAPTRPAKGHWSQSPLLLTMVGALILLLGVVVGYFIK